MVGGDGACSGKAADPAHVSGLAVVMREASAEEATQTLSNRQRVSSCEAAKCPLQRA